MSGSVAIETNRAALVRIVASLIAMAGLARVGHLPPEASNQGRSADVDAAAETVRRVGSWRQRASAPTITRHVWRTILSLLRPAEAAARRLIIAAARGITVPPPRLRESTTDLKHARTGRPMPLTARTLPQPTSHEAFLRRFGIAVTGTPPLPRFTRSLAGASHLSRPSFGPPASQGRIKVADGRSANPPPFTGEGDHAQRGGGGILATPRIPAFPLFDPLRRLRLKPARRYVPAHAAPRIMFPGITQPHRLPPPPPPPAPDDLVSAVSVARRLAALAAALDDLPKQARRFARLKARMDAQAAQDRAVAEASEARGSAPPRSRRRFRRTSPLRGGPPYGGRLAVWDPTVPNGKHIREVDVILAHAHALADYALAFPDTS